MAAVVSYIKIPIDPETGSAQRAAQQATLLQVFGVYFHPDVCMYVCMYVCVWIADLWFIPDMHVCMFF